MVLLDLCVECVAVGLAEAALVGPAAEHAHLGAGPVTRDEPGSVEAAAAAVVEVIDLRPGMERGFV